jgi:hypothetical protein
MNHRIHFGVCAALVVACATSFTFGQAKSSIQFYDTTGQNKTLKLGWTGATDGHGFVTTPTDGEVVTVRGKDLTVKGAVTAGSYSGNGGGLTGVQVDSIAWGKIKGIPAGFADGVDNEGSGTGGVDSVRAARVADSAKTVANGAVSSAKIADGTVTEADLAAALATKINGKGAGDITGVGAGTGLTGGGAVDSVTLNVNFAGSGSAATAARSDHDHSDSVPVSRLPAKLQTLNNGSYQGTGFNVTTDTLFKKSPSYYNNIKLFNSSIRLSGYPTIEVVPGPGLAADPGLMFGKPEDYTGSYDRDRTNFHFSARVNSPGGSASILVSDNLNLISTYNTDGSTISTLTGSINFTPQDGLVKVNGVTVHTSDSLLKKNIVPLDSALQKINGIQTVYFDFKTEEYPNRNLPKSKQIGVIAQNVETVFPELVYTDCDGIKSVDYDKLGPILIEAIQEQQVIINRQNLKIEEVLQQINRIAHYLNVDASNFSMTK